MKLVQTALAVFLVLLLSGCSEALSSICEGRVNLAYQTASRTSYDSGRKAGVKAALDCIYSQGGRSEQAVENCRKKIR